MSLSVPLGGEVTAVDVLLAASCRDLAQHVFLVMAFQGVARLKQFLLFCIASGFRVNMIIGYTDGLDEPIDLVFWGPLLGKTWKPENFPYRILTNKDTPCSEFCLLMQLLMDTSNTFKEYVYVHGIDASSQLAVSWQEFNANPTFYKTRLGIQDPEHPTYGTKYISLRYEAVEALVEFHNEVVANIRNECIEILRAGHRCVEPIAYIIPKALSVISRLPGCSHVAPALHTGSPGHSCMMQRSFVPCPVAGCGFGLYHPKTLVGAKQIATEVMLARQKNALFVEKVAAGTRQDTIDKEVAARQQRRDRRLAVPARPRRTRPSLRHSHPAPVHFTF